jgi:hypothetical protein
MSEPFLIDVFNDSLVVIPLGEARRLAALNDALQNSQTWGEFLDAVARDLATARELAAKFGDELPAREDAFDPDDIYGFADGDWPAWPMQKMLDWLPESVQQLGTIQATAINGDALEIDEDLLQEVIEALAAEGFEGYEDPGATVQAACGAWRYE